jgi:outer membrane protein assembly factor BamB
MTLLGGGVANAATVPGCAAPATGGDWPSYSGGLPAPGAPGGNRIQPAEQTITPANVSNLGLAWKLPSPDGGLIHDTPTEVDGCVFFGTDLGTIVAANADTGKIAWQNKLANDKGSSAFAGAGIVGSPAISNGIVYVGVTAPSASLEVALSETTGQVIWTTVVDNDTGGGVDASPVPFNGMVFQAYQGDESSPHSWPGWVIMDATTGAILVKTHTIAQADFNAGMRGASVVDTAAVDVDKQVLYVGTGNPASANRTPLGDAILKVDVNPIDSTFGQILGSVPGDSESYPAPTDVTPPTCSQTNNLQWPVKAFSCGQFDMDFLASGDLYTNSSGRQVFGEMQKSGVFHAVYTDTMQPAWKTTLGPGCFGCNLSSSAEDANGIYVATTGGNLYALNKDTGAIKWAATASGANHFNGITVANSVVYDVNDLGAVEAFNAANGTPLLAHPLIADSGTPYSDTGNSSGLSVARDTVFFSSQAQPSAGSTLFAFKPGSSSGLPPVPSPPPLPGLPGGTPAQTILTAPGGTNTTFATPVIVLPQGQPLNYTNLDTVTHNVTSTTGLFSAPSEGLGKSEPVAGVQNLKPGTYSFYCSLHPWMTGQIIVK